MIKAFRDFYNAISRALFKPKIEDPAFLAFKDAVDRHFEKYPLIKDNDDLIL